MTYAVVAVQVVWAFGARVVTGQVVAPALASLIVNVLSVTVPVFFTTNDHWMRSPRSLMPLPLTSVIAADLVSVSAGAWLTGVSVCEVLEVTVALAGFLPVETAVLDTMPLSTSAWVTVY